MAKLIVHYNQPGTLGIFLDVALVALGTTMVHFRSGTADEPSQFNAIPIADIDFIEVENDER